MVEECYQAFEDYRPSPKNDEILRVTDRILSEYHQQGYSLTVRACYYRLLSLGMIESSQAEYRSVQEVIKKGRMAGRIAWNHISDNSRRLESVLALENKDRQVLIRIASRWDEIRKMLTA